MPRGREATSPTQIPLSGWKDIFWRVRAEVGSDSIGLIAAGVAFYALLALFPAVTAVMALAGLILDPHDVTEQISSMSALLPKEAAQIIFDQAIAVTGSEDTGLGFAFLFGLLLALYSASSGMGSLIQGLNVAYDEGEKRGFVRLTAIKLALTLFLIFGLIVGLIAALVVPALLAYLPLPAWLENLLALTRWVVLGALSVSGLAVLYRWGPSREHADWRWLTPGAVAACILWIIGTIGFSVYVSNFGSYNETFGSLAGVIVLLLWLWLSSYIILLGAELNSEIEAQTARDSTTGPELPMGQRGATKADMIGASSE